MTPAKFTRLLRSLGYTLRGFATFTGCNVRTVMRWASGEQDIPPWVPVMLQLMMDLAEMTSTAETLQNARREVLDRNRALMTG